MLIHLTHASILAILWLLNWNQRECDEIINIITVIKI